MSTHNLGYPRQHNRADAHLAVTPTDDQLPGQRTPRRVLPTARRVKSLELNDVGTARVVILSAYAAWSKRTTVAVRNEGDDEVSNADDENNCPGPSAYVHCFSPPGYRLYHHAT